MFGLRILKTRRARRAVETARRGVSDAFSGQPAAEKAAILAVANAILASVAARHGERVLTKPAALKPAVAVDIVVEFSVSLAKLQIALEGLGDRDFGDPVLDGVHRQMRSVELVVATVGMSIDPSIKKTVVAGWDALYRARRNAGEAVAALAAFEEETGTSPVPEGLPSDRDSLLSMATTPPPFLVPKKRAA